MFTLDRAPETVVPMEQATPTRIFETLNRYQQTMALKGAIDLNLFTHIADGASSAHLLAERASASERGMRILCDYLTVTGFLTKTDGRYGLTRDSALFLNQRSPAYMGTISDFIANDCSRTCFRDVAALVRKGGALDGAKALEPDCDRWVEFARSMQPIAGFSARLLTPLVNTPGRKVKVLDIAAGHGMFGISLAAANPEASVVAVDWKPVLEVAAANARKANVQDRWSTIAGSAFDVDFGAGFDLVLIPNFLHHFDHATKVRLLKRIRAAMNKNGRVASLEFVPNEDRVSPPICASFSMIMLGHTEKGDAYTFRELDRMFREAGFRESRIQDLTPTPQQLILTAF